MRLLMLLLTLAAVAYAIPGPSNLIQAESDAFAPRPGDELQVKEGYPPADFVPIKRSPDPVHILDDLMDAHENEKRTANLSPVNNPGKGLLPRACSYDSTCPCARGAKPGLWCGYCDAVSKCLSGSCLNWAYQCGPGGGCCTYGYRNSCAQRNEPCDS